MRSLSSAVLSRPKAVFKPALVVVAVMSLSACNALGLKAPWDDDQIPDYALISENLINSISQFPHLNPLMATVQVVEPSSTFAQHVHQELSDQGYKLEPSSDDAIGSNVVKAHTNQIVRTGTGKQNLYVLSVGDVSVERAYDTVAGKTVPVSELVVRGMDQRDVELNDDIFEVPDSPFSTVAYKPVNGPTLKKEYGKRKAESAPVVAAALPAPQAERITTEAKLPELPGNVIKFNMYGTLISNYANVFEDYEEIDRQTLIFPNDSLRIGDNNKSIIEELATTMDPDTDILSVIGCSHGGTEINNGNSLLALGRANRVKESFLFLGMEHDKVLEEGCWAPVLFDQMPKRGVVVTLKRRKDS